MKFLFIFAFLCIFDYSMGVFIRPAMLTNERTSTRLICRADNGAFNDNQLKCYDRSHIKVVVAHYGFKARDRCPIQVNETDTNRACSETIETTRTLKRFCDGKVECTVKPVDLNLPENCPLDAHISLSVEFRCEGNVLRFQPFTGNSLTGQGRRLGQGRGFGNRRTMNQQMMNQFGNLGQSRS